MNRKRTKKKKKPLKPNIIYARDLQCGRVYLLSVLLLLGFLFYFFKQIISELIKIKLRSTLQLNHFE